MAKNPNGVAVKLSHQGVEDPGGVRLPGRDRVLIVLCVEAAKKEFPFVQPFNSPLYGRHSPAMEG